MKSLRPLFIFISLVVAFAAGFSLLGATYGVPVAIVAYLAINSLLSPLMSQKLGANTLTSLIPDAFAALDVVSRELVGFIPAVTRDASVDRVALNQTLRAHQTAANTAGRTITPAMGFPAAADQTVGNKSLTITKTRAFPFSWTGEEQKSINAGPGYLNVRQDQIAQAMRAAVNEIEADLAVAAQLGASRAFGTAGTTPYASDLSASAQLKKILDDNGAPISDRSHVLNTTAGAALRSLLNNPLNANLSLNGPMTAQGVLLDLNGFKFREAAAVQAITKGTGTSYTSSAAGFAIGATSIAIITGSGTVVAGDVVTFAGDTNKYVVATGVAAPGTIVLQAPGLRQAIPASATAMTIGNSYTANIGLSRNALVLATRLPAIPEEGDLAILRETISDDRSGLSFELAVYPGYRMLVYELGVCWGTLAAKPEHLAILLG
jgi:hypothetical protein